MELKFYRCKKCGQFALSLKKSPCDMFCCGEPMKELKAGETEGAAEKHIPVMTVDGNMVKVVVGSVLHPMTEPHYIEWIMIETKHGMQKKDLLPTDEPKACFALTQDDEVVAAYAYCNLHGLWKASK